MLLIRPCTFKDLDDLMAISHAVGRGMTSMPADETAWQEKNQRFYPGLFCRRPKETG